MLCHACGKSFVDTDNEFCPFCGSSDIELVDDDMDDEDTNIILGFALAELIGGE